MASAKRFWRIARAMLLMLRDGLEKRRLAAAQLLTDAGAPPVAISISCCLMDPSSAVYAPREVEFSCSDRPFLTACRREKHRDLRRRQRRRSHDCYRTAAVEKAFEILDSATDRGIVEAESPAAAIVRVTDSPFPLSEEDETDDSVDSAAEEFIRGFYEQLRRQKMAAKSPMRGFR
ncbi:hypothetical protein KFK09_025836 [Dendrobium nobile]|uniref:Avr9/Cf-9 rapidly elicited protein 146 n=1 Tax=Dendrobium nobile TaxID=94219 RepID=A0A8T3A4Z8_DENNO|nr:hypothetical protein KFK09_025836 [Dendrobium nobile]